MMNKAALTLFLLGSITIIVTGNVLSGSQDVCSVPMMQEFVSPYLMPVDDLSFLLKENLTNFNIPDANISKNSMQNI